MVFLSPSRRLVVALPLLFGVAGPATAQTPIRIDNIKS